MGFFDRLFGRKGAPKGAAPASRPAPALPDAGEAASHQLPARELDLEGDSIPVFTAEAAFLADCQETGLAALVLPFAEFWPVFGRGLQSKALTGAVRLLCSTCLVDMATSFRFSLPGGLGSMVGGIIAVGEGLPDNLSAAAKAAKCPYCGTSTALLLQDDIDPGDITEQDLEAFRQLWRFRCQVWWQQNRRSESPCDRCSSTRIPRGEGYHTGSEVLCEACTRKMTGPDALAKLTKDPNYFGISELRRARNFKEGAWRLEPGRMLESGSSVRSG